MKLSKFALFGGALAAVVGQSASAWIIGTDTPDITVFMSGATATEKALQATLETKMCKSNVDAWNGSNQIAVMPSS